MENVIKLTAFAPTQNNGNYKVGQTVAEFLGKDGKIGWASATNFFNKDKKLSVQMIVDGARYYINCSKPLGDLARADKANFEGTAFLNKLASCLLTEVTTEDGELVQFIGLPNGVTASTMFSASELKPEPFTLTVANLESLAI